MSHGEIALSYEVTYLSFISMYENANWNENEN